jgi:hypothetical protein
MIYIYIERERGPAEIGERRVAKGWARGGERVGTPTHAEGFLLAIFII